MLASEREAQTALNELNSPRSAALRVRDVDMNALRTPTHGENREGGTTSRVTLPAPSNTASAPGCSVGLISVGSSRPSKSSSSAAFDSSFDDVDRILPGTNSMVAGGAFGERAPLLEATAGGSVASFAANVPASRTGSMSVGEQSHSSVKAWRSSMSLLGVDDEALAAAVNEPASNSRGNVNFSSELNEVVAGAGKLVRRRHSARASFVGRRASADGRLAVQVRPLPEDVSDERTEKPPRIKRRASKRVDYAGIGIGAVADPAATSATQVPATSGSVAVSGAGESGGKEGAAADAGGAADNGVEVVEGDANC